MEGEGSQCKRMEGEGALTSKRMRIQLSGGIHILGDKEVRDVKHHGIIFPGGSNSSGFLSGSDTRVGACLSQELLRMFSWLIMPTYLYTHFFLLFPLRTS